MVRLVLAFYEGSYGLLASAAAVLPLIVSDAVRLPSPAASVAVAVAAAPCNAARNIIIAGALPVMENAASAVLFNESAGIKRSLVVKAAAGAEVLQLRRLLALVIRTFSVAVLVPLVIRFARNDAKKEVLAAVTVCVNAALSLPRKAARAVTVAPEKVRGAEAVADAVIVASARLVPAQRVGNAILVDYPKCQRNRGYRPMWLSSKAQ